MASVNKAWVSWHRYPCTVYLGRIIRHHYNNPGKMGEFWAIQLIPPWGCKSHALPRHHVPHHARFNPDIKHRPPGPGTSGAWLLLFPDAHGKGMVSQPHLYSFPAYFMPMLPIPPQISPIPPPFSLGAFASAPPPPRVTFRLVVVPLWGPGQSPVLPFACCIRLLLSVGCYSRCSC